MAVVDELQNNLIAKVIIEMTTGKVSEVWFKISFLVSHN